jgi:alpha-glucosidase
MPALPVLKIRGGAIVPLGRVVQSTTQPLLEPLTLMVSLDADGRAQGSLYEDDGEGYGYRDGDYLLTTYGAQQVGEAIEVRIASEEGNRSRPARTIEVVVVTDGGSFRQTGSETSTIVVSLQ